MKFFVVFLAIVAAVQADDWTPKTEKDFIATHSKCITECQVPQEDIDKMKHLEYADNKPIHKYILCCVIDMGLFSPLHGFYTDRLTEQFKGDLPAAEVKPTMDYCFDKERGNSTLDEFAYQCHECFLTTEIGQNSLKYINSVIYPEE